MVTYANHFNTRTMAENFDEFLGPRLFVPWGELLLEQVDLQPGYTALDVATGPGTLAELIARRVGASGRVVGTDISPEMLSVAWSKPPVPGGARIEYILSAASPLNVRKKSFDVAVCAQGLLFCPEPVAALQAMHRALKPNGQVAISIWCSSDANPYFYAIVSSFRKVRASLNGGMKHQDSFLQYYQPDQLVQMFAESGFHEIKLSRKTLPMVIEGGIPQALAGVAATAHQSPVANFSLAQRALFNQEMAIYLNRYLADGKLVIPTSCYIVIAKA
jgi:ubiquinone/menaquinone biosynthesis C-methylase UbiE